MQRHTFCVLPVFALTLLAVAVPSFAANELVNFIGQVPGAANWSVPCTTCGGDMTLDFSSTMSGTQAKWAPQTNNFTNAVFAGMMGASGNLIALRQLDTASSLEFTTMQVTFPQPLRPGSTMFILDIDAIDEKIVISKDNGEFGAPVQMETMAGATSIFATWDPVEQSLTAIPGAGDNQKEAYLFDVSGAQSMTFIYSTGRPAIANVGFNVVPEPSSAVLWPALGIVWLWASRRKPHYIGRNLTTAQIVTM